MFALAVAAAFTSPEAQRALQPPYEPTLVFRRTITPAAVAPPLLRYELLPPRRDQTVGNAAVDYLRAATFLPKEPPRDPDAFQQRLDILANWRAAPLDKFPTATVEAELKSYRRAMAAADRAARMPHCDWQFPRPLTITTAVESFDSSPLRETVGWLRLRFKVELAQGRFDDALRTLQTAVQMSKHVGDGPTLIQSLVGVALLAITLDAAAEWGTAPGSPNLYWALATLPSPLLDLRAVAAGEMEIMTTELGAVAAFGNGPLSEAQAREAVAGMKNLQAFEDVAYLFESKPTGFWADLTRWAGPDSVAWRAPPARAWLRAHGLKPADVAAMADTQAVYLAGWLRFRVHADAVTAAALLPTADAVPAVLRAEAAANKDLAEVRSDPFARGVLRSVPSAWAKVLLSHVRARRQLAAVQAIEAVRAQLAASGGVLPKSWDDVTVVPVPADPLTGKPFGYKLANGVAMIIGPPPAGEVLGPSNNFRYELTVRPGK